MHSKSRAVWGQVCSARTTDSASNRLLPQCLASSHLQTHIKASARVSTEDQSNNTSKRLIANALVGLPASECQRDVHCMPSVHSGEALAPLVAEESPTMTDPCNSQLLQRTQH